MDLDKYTGEKLSKLEKNPQVQGFLKTLLHAEHADISTENRNVIGKFFQAIWKKNFASLAPISDAHYSAIFVYEFEGQFYIHAGANIDPETKERLSSIEHRNCAERQASISAARHDEMQVENLKAIFLYRRPDPKRRYTAEKLLPCIDCYNKYVKYLIENGGSLVTFYHEDRHYKFFDDEYAEYLGEDEAFMNKKLTINSRFFTKSPTVDISSVTAAPKRIFYRIFNQEDLLHINYEKTLGGRVLMDEEVTKLAERSILSTAEDQPVKSSPDLKLQISKSRSQKES